MEAETLFQKKKRNDLNRVLVLLERERLATRERDEAPPLEREDEEAHLPETEEDEAAGQTKEEIEDEDEATQEREAPEKGISTLFTSEN